MYNYSTLCDHKERARNTSIKNKSNIIGLQIALALIRSLGRFIELLKKVGHWFWQFIKPVLVLLTNIIIVKPYRIFLKIKWLIKKWWPKLPTLKLLSHHQSILYLLLLGASLVVTNSWQIHQAAAEDFGQNNLLFPLIKPEFELIVTESGISNLNNLPDQIIGINTINPSETTTNNQHELSGTGAAILKPHLITSAPSTATRTAVEYYVVEEGDTISSIAERFGLNMTTLLWENRLTARSIIRAGQKLTILPADGVTYRIGRGDTIGKIAQKYGVTADSILNYNKISSSTLTIGQTIVIPGGRPLSAPATIARTTTTVSPNTSPVSSSTRLLWPTSVKRMTQYYTWRHGGVDIAGPTGTPIYAAEEGIVEIAGWNKGGYGNYIIIDHGGGLKTLYGHASKLLVSAGDRVGRGDEIAKMGSTGRSTGPHLHFETRVRGARTNPLNYIR